MLNNFMQIAIDEAKIAFANDEVPVGAVIVKDGKIVAKSHNQNRKLNDCCGHAEILALRDACKKLNSARLDGCDLYVTLEPCSMCAAAISFAKINRLYYGLGDEKFGAVENGVQFFANAKNYFKPEIYSGFFEIEIRNLMQDFFRSKR
jgi:tRNA(Arg) A34 adenosine deaminase TadA